LTFNAFVYEVGGRIVSVQPDTQTVEPMVAWVTAGLSAPGVKAGSGSPGSLAIDAGGVGAGMPVGPGLKPIAGVSLAAGSSSESPVSPMTAPEVSPGEAVGTPVAVGEAVGEGVAVGEAVTVGVAAPGPHPASRPAVSSNPRKRIDRWRVRIRVSSQIPTSPDGSARSRLPGRRIDDQGGPASDGAADKETRSSALSARCGHPRPAVGYDRGVSSPSLVVPRSQVAG
jgi:hypothetical protein